jgi:transcriptional regulator with PAS, ATPase and Fis domain
MDNAPIQVIAPNAGMVPRAQMVAREMGIENQVACHVANLENGLKLASRLHGKGGVEVFIARRGTAEIIKKNLQVPLVQIPVSLEDMAQALGEARTLTGLEKPRIGFFALPTSQDELAVFAKLLDFDLAVYHVTFQEVELERTLEGAIADRIHVVVGGSVVTMLAQQRKFPAVFLDSGIHSMRQALREASEIAYARTLEKTQQERFKAIVDNYGDGVLLLDEKQCVCMANPASLHILRRNRIPYGVPVTEILGGLDLTDCYTGVPSRNIVLSTMHGSLLVSGIPSVVGGMVKSAVVFFTPARSVAELGAVIRRNKQAKDFAAQYDFDDIIGASPQIAEAKGLALKYARGESPVLVVGETGTGKELFAHAIHRASPVSSGPFVTVNCASLPTGLLESELFGYEEGAFTGAKHKGKPGLFELAHHGSIFLDEISELEPLAQSRLLRVIQEQTTMRLGGNKVLPLDIRVIAATNRNLWSMVGKGTFREDLFYRLGALPVFIPPLRERTGDIEFLLNFALHLRGSPNCADLRTNSALYAHLLKHDWPGNVRELFNVVARILMNGQKSIISSGEIDTLLHPYKKWHSLNMHGNVPDIPSFPQNEKSSIEEALKQNKGNRTKTAAQLGMNRSTLYRKMLFYSLHV